MPDLWMDADADVVVPMNVFPLTDDTDFKSVETGVVHDSAGLLVYWNFVSTAGVQTQVLIDPTETGGAHDVAHLGAGMYSIEIPATGGAHASNDAEGFGWVTGIATGVLPWRGPTIGFRAASLNNILIDAASGAVLSTHSAEDVKTTLEAEGAKLHDVHDRMPASGTVAVPGDEMVPSEVTPATDISGLATKTEVLALSPVQAAPDISGLATGDDLDTAQAAIIEAMPADAPDPAAIETACEAALDDFDAMKHSDYVAPDNTGIANAKSAADTAASAAGEAHAAADTAANAATEAKDHAHAVQATTDALATMLEADGAVSHFTANALEHAPSATAPTVEQIDAELAANHGAGLWGSAAAGDVLLTHASEDDEGDVIGITTANAEITAYLAADTLRTTPKRTAQAETDGQWALYLAPDATYTLVFSLDGYEETTRTVST